MDMEEDMDFKGRMEISELSSGQSEISGAPRRYIQKKRNFKCSFPRCRHRTTSEARLLKHNDKAHCKGGKEILKCSHPGCNFPGTFLPSMLERHHQVHIDKKPIPCLFEGCEYSTFRSDNLTAHAQRKHTDRSESEYACPVADCQYFGGTASDLRRHTYIHTGECNFYCNHPGCTYRAYQKSKVARHSNTVHDKVVRSAPATDWSKKNLKKVKDIDVRPDAAATEVTFKCKNGGCELSFKTAMLLQNHVKSHFDDKAYECPTCGYYAKRGMTMVVHMEREGHRDILPLWSTISQNWVAEMLAQEKSFVNSEDSVEDGLENTSAEIFSLDVQMEIDVETQQKKK